MKRRSLKMVKMIILVLFSFVITGCASVSYSRQVFEDGRVEDKFLVSIQKSDILPYMNNDEYNLLVASIKSDIGQVFFNSVNKFVVSVNNDNLLSVQEKNMLIKGITNTISVNENNDIVEATVVYANSVVFNSYYKWLQNSSGEEVSDGAGLDIDKRPFTVRVNQNTDNVYSDLIESEIGIVLINKYENFMSEFVEKNIANVKFYQTYGTYDTKLKSNADIVYMGGGIKNHTWEIKPVENTKLNFYTISPNASSWYILSLGVAGVVVVVTLWRAFNIQREDYKKLLGIK